VDELHTAYTRRQVQNRFAPPQDQYHLRICHAVQKKIFKYLKRHRFLASFLLLPIFAARFFYYTCREQSFWFLRHYPGHYSSTLPSWAALRDRWPELQKQVAHLQDGVDLNHEGQRSLLKEFSEYDRDFCPPETPTAGRLYHSHNDMFGYSDAFILYCFLRQYRPRQVIEVGSGHSSALMLDTASLLSLETMFTFIDPYSVTISQVLASKPAIPYRLIRTPVQEIDPSIFAELDEGDILFIDSSHVLKIGSDLTSLLFNVLPRLRKGVLVHFHDISYPFEYSRELVSQGRAWNEIYFVRCFLQFNSAFQVLFFGGYVDQAFRDFIQLTMPRYAANGCSSLWLYRTS
jgi:hypothetical protein